jgi:hypothetical protein
VQAILITAFLAGTAHAGGWSDLAGAFPLLPCQDGWAGCIVDGLALNADMRPDSQGVPMPADLRFDWFTLEGMPVLSPFTPLSSYSEERVAQADEPAPGDEEDLPAAPVREVAATGGAGESHPLKDPGSRGQTTGGRTGGSGSGTGSAEPAVASTGGMRPGFSPTGSLPGASAAAPAGSEGPATCNDLVALEPAALMGQLTGGQRGCLEDRLSSAGKQTEKDKVSRVLLADAEARGDKTGWARLMKRHLEEIDRSDPDLCFKYAIYLSRLDVARANGVIRWSDYALENKSRWQGTTYVSRVYALLKLKAEAANRIWQSTEEEYVKNRNDENEAKAGKYRNTTKEYARAWLDYARVSSQDTKSAMALCVSAAGSRQFCEGG